MNTRLLPAAGICAIIALVMISSTALAGTYTFQSRDSGGTRTDFEDFDHTQAYLWTFKWTPVAGEVVTGATLTFNSIYNNDDTKNWLGVWLIKDKASAGTGWSAWTTDRATSTDLTPDTAVYQKGDNQVVPTPFDAVVDKVLVGAYSDTRRGSSITDTITFDFANPELKSASNPTWGWSIYDDRPLEATVVDDLAAWCVDGDWALGIDPDCHFYNCGVKLTITTKAKTPPPDVPEPFSMALGALGLGVVGAVRRLRKS